MIPLGSDEHHNMYKKKFRSVWNNGFGCIYINYGAYNLFFNLKLNFNIKFKQKSNCQKHMFSTL